MAKLFDYQNPVWRFMGRVADLFFLTLLWVVGSLPVITIGASTTALYYVALKMVKNQEGYLWKSYWHSYRENLGIATGVWCVMLVIGGAFAGGFAAISRMETQAASFYFWWLLLLSLLYLFVLTLIFPLAARLDTGVTGLFGMTFMTAVKNFSWVMLMLVITLCVTALGIFVFWPLLLLGAGIISYAHALILVHVIFPKYNWNNI